MLKRLSDAEEIGYPVYASRFLCFCSVVGSLCRPRVVRVAMPIYSVLEVCFHFIFFSRSQNSSSYAISMSYKSVFSLTQYTRNKTCNTKPYLSSVFEVPLLKHSVCNDLNDLEFFCHPPTQPFKFLDPIPFIFTLKQYIML